MSRHPGKRARSLAPALALLAALLGAVPAGTAPLPAAAPGDTLITPLRPGTAVAAGDTSLFLPGTIPLADGVRDPVFALLVGMVRADLFGTLDRARLRTAVARSGRPTRLPLDRFRSVRRMPLGSPRAAVPGAPARPGPRARLILTADGPLDLDAPYDILGYHPGRFRSSAVLVLDEWRLGPVRLEVKGPDGPEVAVLDDFTVWGLRSGTLEMDVDGWLDALMGPRLDDTRMVGFALFRYRGERIALATGYTGKGQGRSGAFRLRDDEIVFPNRPEFMAAGAYARARLERLMPSVLRFRSR